MSLLKKMSRYCISLLFAFVIVSSGNAQEFDPLTWEEARSMTSEELKSLTLEDTGWEFENPEWLKVQADISATCVGVYRFSSYLYEQLGKQNTSKRFEILESKSFLAAQVLLAKRQEVRHAPFNAEANDDLIESLASEADLHLKALLESSNGPAAPEQLATALKMCIEMKLLHDVIQNAHQRFGLDWEAPTAPAPTPNSNEPLVSMGTCFYVSPTGHIVTNHHVVDGAKVVSITDSSGSQVTAKVVKVDFNNDLVVLHAPAENHAYLSFSPLGSLEIGQEIFTMGYPVSDILGQEPKYTNGVVSSQTGYSGAANVFQMTVPIQPGNSGGPIVNRQGQVVGIATSSAEVGNFLDSSGTLPQNINWAVKSDYAMVLLLSEIPEELKKSKNLNEAISATADALCSIHAIL